MRPDIVLSRIQFKCSETSLPLQVDATAQYIARSSTDFITKTFEVTAQVQY